MTTPDATPSGQGTPPTCYRHPDRETWVSCVRCGRHACPDCLRSAAVGQQCVDCVSGAAQTTRRPTTVFGGRPTRSATVTWTLIAVNVLLFLVELAKPNIANDWGLLGYAQFTNGSQLWKSDGTAVGTVMVHDFTGASAVRLGATGSTLFVGVVNEGGSALWTSGAASNDTPLASGPRIISRCPGCRLSATLTASWP